VIDFILKMIGYAAIAMMSFGIFILLFVMAGLIYGMIDMYFLSPTA
jgi:hypothetical protein